MTGPAWAFLGIAALFLLLYLTACSERDRRAVERDEARRTAATQEAVLYAMLAERRLQATRTATVTPLLPRQRKGDAS